MKDSMLNDLLGKLEVPPLDEAARERARYRAATAFANRPSGQTDEASFVVWWKLAFSVIVLGLIVVCLWLAPIHQSLPNCDAQLLAEMEKAFPGQLDGVICSNGNVDLDIAPEVSRPNPKQALALTLRRGKQIVRVLGFSGHQVSVYLGGKVRSFEPLVTGDGRIIVQGDDFVWTDTEPTKVGGYQIEAKALPL